MKSVFWIVLVIVGLLVFISWLLTTKRLMIYKDLEYEVNVDGIPYFPIIAEFFELFFERQIPFLSREGIINLFSYNHVSSFKLTFGVWEKPRLLFFSKEKKALFVVYDLDVDYVVFVIEEKSEIVESEEIEYMPTWKLKQVIKKLTGQLMARDIIRVQQVRYLNSLKAEYERRERVNRIVQYLSRPLVARNVTVQEIHYLIAAIEELSEQEYRNSSVPSLDIGFYKYTPPKESIISLLEWEIKRRAKESNNNEE